MSQGEHMNCERF